MDYMLGLALTRLAEAAAEVLEEGIELKYSPYDRGRLIGITVRKEER